MADPSARGAPRASAAVAGNGSDRRSRPGSCVASDPAFRGRDQAFGQRAAAFAWLRSSPPTPTRRRPTLGHSRSGEGGHAAPCFPRIGASGRTTAEYRGASEVGLGPLRGALPLPGKGAVKRDSLLVVPSGTLRSASRDARDPEEGSASAPAEMHLREASASDQAGDRRLPLRLAKGQRGAVRPAGVPQIVSVVGSA